MTDEDLRRAFQDAPDTATSAEPLDAGLVWRAARGLLSPDQTAAVLDRVAADPSAALAWRLARELPGEPAANNHTWLRAAAAVVLVAAGLLLVVVGLRDRPEAPAEAVYRGVDDRPQLAPLSVPRGQDAAVRWVPVPGARYTLSLLDPDLREVARLEGLQHAEGTWTADVLAKLPGGRGAVQLTVTTAHGTLRSAPAPVVVTP